MKLSTETILARARNRDAVPIAIIERIQPIDQLCNAVCQNGVPFQILIKDLTPEELANLKIGSDTPVVQAVM
jgi:hypothetical protein